jgi:hypothetical protein
MANNLKLGDTVRLAADRCAAAEAAARFVVVDLRGPRVLIRLVCDLPIAPTECVLVSDVVRV